MQMDKVQAITEIVSSGGKPNAEPEAAREIDEAGFDQPADDQGSREAGTGTEAGGDFETDQGAGSDQGEGGEQPVPESDEPLKLQELADALDVEVAELYDLHIPLGDGSGETFTLGEVKDALPELRSLETAREEMLARQTENENQVLTARRELETIIRIMGAHNITPELAEQARAEISAMQQREQAALMEVIPAWREPETARRERAEINKALRERGFTEAEIQQTYDHRLLKVAHDLVRYEQNAARGREQLREQRKRRGARASSKATATKSDNRKLVEQGKATKNPRTKAALITKLRGG